MSQPKQSRSAVRAGDLDGLGRVYSQWGGLLCRQGEEMVKSVAGWEMDVRSPWRSVLPGMIFLGFGGPASSTLYITNQRIVLIREIDIFRELKSQLTPLGIPDAAVDEVVLRKKKAAGARQFCELSPASLRICRVKRHGRPVRALDLYLTGPDRRQYAVSIWKSVGSDPETISLIESRFIH